MLIQVSPKRNHVQDPRNPERKTDSHTNHSPVTKESANCWKTEKACNTEKRTEFFKPITYFLLKTHNHINFLFYTTIYKL